MAADESHDDKTQSFVALTKGTKVSHYEIINKIGAGGMGEVYLAEDTKLKRQVALKFLPANMSADEDFRNRFKREAQATAKLNHPNIVHIYEVSEFRGRPFFAMEHVEGRSLRDVKAEELDIDRIIGIAIQLCDGLHSAHTAGVTHRDIKPSNIIIDSSGRPKLLDFGLATVKGGEHLTKTGSTLGTVGYMSPEQIEGKATDARSDLFSLGVVLYELIANKSPFRRDDETATLKAILHDAPEPLSRYKSGVPDDLQRVVGKLLEKNPALRYQSAAGVIPDLKRLSHDSRDRTSVSLTAKPSTRFLRIGLPVIIVLCIIALLVLKPWRFSISTDHEAIASENRLAIMYFHNMADPADSQMLGEIATNLLITDLSESRFVQVVSSQRLYDILKNMGREGEKKIDPSVATQIAERAKARWTLQGSILQTVPEMILTAHLVEVSSGNTVASQRINGEPGENIFDLVDKLTVEIKADLSLPEEAMEEEDRSVANVTTHSPEAYRYYLEGVELGFRLYFTDAERVLRKAIELDSTFAMAYYRLGGVTSGAERREMAAKALKFANNVSHYERLIVEGFYAFVNGDAAGAIAIGHKIISRYPVDKEMYFTLGAIYRFGLRQLDSAIVYYRKAIELDSLHEATYNALAYCYKDIGDLENSIWAINKYIELAPDQANPFDTRGDMYASGGQIEKAIESYKKAIDIKPDFYPSWEKLGHMYLFKQDYDEAARCYEKLLESPSRAERSDGRAGLARIPVYQGRFADAFELMQQVIAADRMEKAENWEKLGEVARIHAEKGNVEKTLEAIWEASADFLENRGPVLPFYHITVEVLADVGRLIEAEDSLEVWRSAIEQHDTTYMPFYYIGAGIVARVKGDYEVALGYLTHAIEEFADRDSPYGFRSRLQLAHTYKDMGNLGEAIALYERLITNYGEGRLKWTIESVKLHYYLAMAYEESGWNNKAIEQYETFLEIWKNADEGLVSIGDAKVRLATLKHGI